MQYPVKYILPVQYPLYPPKIYFDFQLPLDVVKSVDYIGDNNMLSIPYIKAWNP